MHRPSKAESERRGGREQGLSPSGAVWTGLQIGIVRFMWGYSVRIRFESANRRCPLRPFVRVRVFFLAWLMCGLA
jgi:hypothetical protein